MFPGVSTVVFPCSRILGNAVASVAHQSKCVGDRGCRPITEMVACSPMNVLQTGPCFRFVR
jgi:hypothetical protein